MNSSPKFLKVSRVFSIDYICMTLLPGNKLELKFELQSKVVYKAITCYEAYPA